MLKNNLNKWPHGYKKRYKFNLILRKVYFTGNI